MRKLLTLALALMLAVVLPVVSFAAGNLVVYTPNPAEEIENILDTFAAKYDVKVETITLGTGDCFARLQAESGNPVADVMFGGVDLNWLNSADNAGLFQEYVAAGNEKLPEVYQNPNGLCTYYILGGSCVMIVNDELEDELGFEIKSYADLLKPELKGMIASADPNASSSAFAHLCNILLAHGEGEIPYMDDNAWAYVEQLIGQLDGALTSGSSAVYKGTANGEYTVGLSYEVGVAGYLKNGAEGVHAVYPTEGVSWTPTGSAIVAGAKNIDNAKLFMDWLISDECQTIMAEKTVCRGVRPDLFKATEYMPHFDTLNLKYATDYPDNNKQAIIDRWNELWTK